MKKISIILLFLALLLCSCTGNQSDQASTSPDPSINASADSARKVTEANAPQNIAGYIVYTDTDGFFSFQYPDAWKMLNKEITDTPQGTQLLTEITKAGMERQALIQSLETVTAIFFDLDQATDGFIPSANIIVQSGSQINQNYLKKANILQEMAETLASQYQAEPFKDYHELSPPEGKELGKNYFLVFQSGYTAAEIKTAIYQAITASNGRLYLFTFSTLSPDFEDALPVFEQVLSSFSIY